MFEIFLNLKFIFFCYFFHISIANSISRNWKSLNFSTLGNYFINYIIFNNETNQKDFIEHILHLNAGNSVWTFRSNIEKELNKGFLIHPIRSIHIGIANEKTKINNLYDFAHSQKVLNLNTFIVILFKEPDFDLISQHKPYNIFFVVPINKKYHKSETYNWYFVCYICNPFLQPMGSLKSEINLNQISVLSVKKHWRDVIAFVNFPLIDSCGEGFFSNTKICEKKERLIATLKHTLKLNITHNLKVLLMENPLTIMMEAKPPFHFSETNFLTNKRKNQFFLLYCNYRVGEEKLKLKAWLAPYSKNVWIILLLTFLLCVLTVILMKFKELKYKGITCFLFVPFIEIIPIFLKQGTANFSSKWLVISLLFAMILFHSVYEFYLTSQLIAPTIPKPTYSNIKEMINKGFKIHSLKYPEGDEKFKISFIMEQDFRDLNISGKASDIIIEWADNLIDMAKVFSLSTPKNVLLAEQDVLINIVKYHRLGNKYPCFTLDQKFGNYPGFSLIQLTPGLSRLVIKTFDRFFEAGFCSLWELWRAFYEYGWWAKFRIYNKIFDIDPIYIFLRNLIPFFIFYIILLLFAVLTFLIEFYMNRKSKVSKVFIR